MKYPGVYKIAVILVLYLEYYYSMWQYKMVLHFVIMKYVY